MNTKWLENVDTFIQARGIKITEFEKRIGVSPGYFSRLKAKIKKGEEVDVHISLLETISKELGFSIDMLINYTIPESCENLLTLERMMNKMIDDTRNRSIIWKEYSAEQLKHEDGLPHLLHQEIIASRKPANEAEYEVAREIYENRREQDPYFEDDDELFYTEFSDYIFESRFDKKAQLDGVSYNGIVSDWLSIYVVSVSVEGKNGWEVYMNRDCGQFNGQPYEYNPLGEIFTTIKEPTDSLEPKVIDLINCIKHTQSDADIWFYEKGIINDYMGVYN